MKKINDKQNIFGDNIAFVEQYDFSTANMSEENRIKAITTVASICYQNPKAIGSESLYNRLLAESKGLPSSSFEFVPVLLNIGEIEDEEFISESAKSSMKIFKHCEIICDGNCYYLLTNYRALVYDVENKFISKKWLKRFSTPEECEIIKQHFKVFLFKVDLPTRSQMVRHRVSSWQELSRRYVSGKKVPFEFYINDKMKNIESSYYMKDYNMNEAIAMCINLYREAIRQGVKPQDARDILPLCTYTEIWSGWQPFALENMLTERTAIGTQWELRQTALAIKDLINENI